MSLSSMFAAGIAFGIPDNNVWVFSGDGAFAMNPGMLMVERQMDLPNLTHFMCSNRAYGSTSNVPLPGRGTNDYAAIARGFGVERCEKIRTAICVETATGGWPAGRLVWLSGRPGDRLAVCLGEIGPPKFKAHENDENDTRTLLSPQAGSLVQFGPLGGFRG